MDIFFKIFKRPKTVFNQHWPLITSLILLWVTILIILIVSLNLNNGIFIYALDDAYIHLAIAKHFALYGIWGVTPYQFSSSASSLLWPLIISAVYLVTGINEMVPFIINIILGSITLYIVYYILRSFKIPSFYNFLVMLTVILFTPIPYLIFIGMEHILQIILVLTFVYLSIQILINNNYKPTNYYLLVILAVLLTMVRYESLFLIFIVSFLFMVKKKFNYSFSIMIFGLLPIVVYGLISILNNWSFFPNSLIIKSSLLSHIPETLTLNSLTNFIYTTILPDKFSHIIADILAIISAILVLSLAAFRFKKKSTIWDAPILWLSIGGLMVFIQLLFIDNAWPLRYTSYLVVLELIAITIGLYSYLPKNLSFQFNKKHILRYVGFAALLILLISPFAIKFYDLSIVPSSTNNIYLQQYQMSMFLKTYYQNDSIAANDIGAINYYANIKCLDMVGLSSNDIAQTHIKDDFNSFNVNNIANQHHVKIAIIYDKWWNGNIPSNWIKVGQWTLPHSVILGNDTISFYATSPENAVELIKNLRLFSPQLPEDIKQTGVYTE